MATASALQEAEQLLFKDCVNEAIDLLNTIGNILFIYLLVFKSIFQCNCPIVSCLACNAIFC